MAKRSVKIYRMEERSDYPDFDIRDQSVRLPLSHLHRHEYFQIQVALKGETLQNISGTVRAFRRGTLSFILPHRMHMIPHPEASRYIVINFSPRFLGVDAGVDPLDLEDIDPAVVPLIAPFLYQEYLDYIFDETAFSKIEHLVFQMINENNMRQFGSIELIKGLLYQLIAFTCKHFEADLLSLRNAPGKRSLRKTAIQRVLAFIRKHLCEDITLQQAAAEAFLSPNYLAHILKKETGRTFTELVTERRLMLAKELLSTTNDKISAIAYATGFADEAYFARRFKHSNGMSPRTFRVHARSIQARESASVRPD